MTAASGIASTGDPGALLRRHPGPLWAARLEVGNRVAVPDILLSDPAGGLVPVLIRGHRTTDPGQGALLTGLDELVSGWGGPADGAASVSAAISAAPSPAPSPALSPARSARKRPRSHHEDALALAHVHRLLQDLGLASTRTIGGVIGLGGPAAEPDWDDGEVVCWHRLDYSASGGVDVLTDYDLRFTDRVAVASAAATRAPALAQPSKVSECRRCPWWPVCGPDMAAAHDVSLLAAGTDADILRAAGAVTYDDVAAMDPAAVRALSLSGIPAGEAQVRAQAMVAGVPLVRRTECVDPVRADVELDVDMESYGDDGAYLWGTYLTGALVPGFAHGYRPFVTWQTLDAPGAAEHFVEFWQYLTALRVACAEAGLTFAAYCYSRAAEQRWLYGTPARFPDVPGMPTGAAVSEFCASTQWVDLYLEIRRLFIVPGSMRLKSVAPIAGFEWRDDEPGGENSMAWYRIAVGTDGGAGNAAVGEVAADGVAAPDVGAVQHHRDRILRYNEDDVLATLRLRQWLSSNPTAMPTVDELAATTSRSPARDW